MPLRRPHESLGTRRRQEPTPLLAHIEAGFQRTSARLNLRNPHRVRVGLRTGDTPSRTRGRHLANPPHILLTTPESLAILLTNPKAEELFRRLRWVVIDEVHALANNKRGADLAVSLERLEFLTSQDQFLPPPLPPYSGGDEECLPLPLYSGGEGRGEGGQHPSRKLDAFANNLHPLTPAPLPRVQARGEHAHQSLENATNSPPKPLDEYSNPADSGPSTSKALHRIALSATVASPQSMAQFVVGAHRQCTVAQVDSQSPLDLTIEALHSDDTNPGFMGQLLRRLESEIYPHRTTLIFTNTRALAERLAWQLKRHLPEIKRRIAVHHSSLAPERRQIVERRLKAGRLDVVVTSTSLELGIDIGSVDYVIFVHPPRGVVRLLQRLGRSGHKPGETRRGLLLTATPAELLEATVTVAAARAGQLEPMSAPPVPLDVLCQQLVGMASTRWWSPHEAFALVRRAHPFRALSRADFDSALDYLSGRHADGRGWLPPRLRWQDERFTITSQRLAALLRRNLGTILAEEPRAIRLLLPAQPSQRPAKRPRSPSARSMTPMPIACGPVIASCWIAVAWSFAGASAAPAGGRSQHAPVVPRWLGSGWALSRELAERLFLFRMQAADALRDGPANLRRWLMDEYSLDRGAAGELADLFILQETVSEIPDSRMLLIETIVEGATCYYFHTPLARPGNDALARILAWRLLKRRGLVMQSDVADLGFTLAVPSTESIHPHEWRLLMAENEFEGDLAQALTTSDALRDRFASVATTGLMVLRQPMGGRRKVGGHDWAARRLFDQVRAADPRFIFLRQAEYEIKTDVCDAGAARAYLARLPECQIRNRRLCEISPFAAAWTQPGTIAGAEATTRAEVLTTLHAELTHAG